MGEREAVGWGGGGGKRGVDGGSAEGPEVVGVDVVAEFVWEAEEIEWHIVGGDGDGVEGVGTGDGRWSGREVGRWT